MTEFFCAWCKTYQPAVHACWAKPSGDEDLPRHTLLERERLEDLEDLRQRDADQAWDRWASDDREWP